MKDNQRIQGFNATILLVAVAMVALIGFIGWQIFGTRPVTTDTSQNAQNQPDSDASTPTGTPVTLKVDTYSLTLYVPDSLKDLAVGSSREGTFSEKTFTEVTLVTDKFKNCETPGGALGRIYKVNGVYNTYPFGVSGLEGTDGAHVYQQNGFYLMFQGPQSYQCGNLDSESTYSLLKQTIIDNHWTHKTK